MRCVWRSGFLKIPGPQGTGSATAIPSRHEMLIEGGLYSVDVDGTPAAVRGGLYLVLDTKLLAAAPMFPLASNCTMSLIHDTAQLPNKDHQQSKKQNHDRYR